ncbi:hypothetical protein POM88_016346 [Heracleum sosnowskyi]|uniref:PGG domain-containing protein n=1 Tax=Heracleum sosnowskyi TaxID=360622 RepID=A0AAD8INT0_9APIA|nr:hypothetical protein POM88_016346 [Heracleum sosnowskyi]
MAGDVAYPCLVKFCLVSYLRTVIVAALISTVALTVGFTMPGGFDDNNGLNCVSFVRSIAAFSHPRTYVANQTLYLKRGLELTHNICNQGWSDNSRPLRTWQAR